MTERCEWNPAADAPATVQGNSYDGCPNESAVSVGADGAWHLCASCAALPRFKKYRSRRPLRALSTYVTNHEASDGK